jgi:hypothetical protein
MEKGDSTEHAKLQNVVINSLMSTYVSYFQATPV